MMARRGNKRATARRRNAVFATGVCRALGVLAAALLLRGCLNHISGADWDSAGLVGRGGSASGILIASSN
jgi:hypothetical protein